jgi:hypothetical protein
MTTAAEYAAYQPADKHTEEVIEYRCNDKHTRSELNKEKGKP